jgi:DNA-binding NarL/FixJ family response regulator
MVGLCRRRTQAELVDKFDRLQRQHATADGLTPTGDLTELFLAARKEFAFAMFKQGKTIRQIGRRLDLTTNEVLELFSIPD